MHRIQQTFLLLIITVTSAFANEASIQTGAQMMLKMAAAELLEELTEGQIPKADLMRFAEKMTDKYPELYRLTDEQAEGLLADESIAPEGSLDQLIMFYSKSDQEPTDLLALILDKRQAQSLSHEQSAFAFQYLRSLNRELIKHSLMESTVDQ